MAAKKTSPTSTSAATAPVASKSAFILAQPLDTPAAAVVEAGKAVGLELSRQYIHNVRGQSMAKAGRLLTTDLTAAAKAAQALARLVGKGITEGPETSAAAGEASHRPAPSPNSSSAPREPLSDWLTVRAVPTTRRRKSKWRAPATAKATPVSKHAAQLPSAPPATSTDGRALDTSPRGQPLADAGVERALAGLIVQVGTVRAQEILNRVTHALGGLEI